jgi:uncharacterized protein (TIGR03435 family)
MEAYNVSVDQISFGTSAPRDDETYYDIVARAEGDGTRTRSDFRLMLQTLLDERFHLKLHREMKERPVYALVVAKNGPRLKESDPNAVFSAKVGVNGRNQDITVSHATMEFLAQAIKQDFFVDRPVIDETGLVGAYDFKVEATPELRLNSSPDPGDISIFTAIQRLGLRLESRKTVRELIVVDHAERPSAN